MKDPSDLQTFRQHWIDALAAFGAHIEIHQLPEGVEHRQSFSAFLSSASEADSEVDESPVRVVVVGRKYVSGPVLVELDKCREQIVQAFSIGTEAKLGKKAA